MPSPTRRTFIGTTAAAVAALGAGEARAGQGSLVHHVLFWLKNPDSRADLEQLLEGVRGLAAIETVRGIHVGVPADTEQRDVVDGSFSVSEILYFDDPAGQAAYQVRPLHQEFVEKHSHLWSRVVVYDVIAA